MNDEVDRHVPGGRHDRLTRFQRPELVKLLLDGRPPSHRDGTPKAGAEGKIVLGVIDESVDLDIGDSLHVDEIELGENVELTTADVNFTVITVLAPSLEEEEEEEEDLEEGEEGEEGAEAKDGEAADEPASEG